MKKILRIINRVNLGGPTYNAAYLTKYLESDYKNLKFFHIGPERDFDLFKLFEKNKVNRIEDCDFLLCTGLFDEYDKNLEYYKKLFKDNFSKKMICTNPDLIVDRGEEREFCAGTIAQLF